MAPLTWRNVDAPNFSSVTDSYRLMGQLLNSGFQSARDAVSDYQDYRTGEESTKLMADVMSARNPEELQGIISKYDPALLSEAAMKFAGGRPQELASFDQTKAVTAGQNLSNDFAKQANPLRLQGLKLQNAASSQAISAARQRAQAEQAAAQARPLAIQRATEIGLLSAQGTPEARAQADKLMGESAQIFAAAGMEPKDVLSMVDHNLKRVTSGMEVTEAFEGRAAKLKGEAEKAQLQQEFRSVMGRANNKEQALELIRSNPAYTPDQVTALIGQIESNWDTVRGAQAERAQVLLEQAIQEDAVRAGEPTPDRFGRPANEGSLNDLNRVIESSQAVDKATQGIIDNVTLDAGFSGGMDGIATALVDRPDKGKPTAEVAKKVFEDIGAGEEGGWIAAEGFNLPTAVTEINRVVDKYGVDPDVAATFLKMALVENAELFGPDVIEVGRSKLDGIVKSFYDVRTGRMNPDKMKGARAVLEKIRAQDNTIKQAQKLRDEVVKAEQDVLDAKRMQQQGRKADVAGAIERFERIRARNQAKLVDLELKAQLFSNSNSVPDR